LTAIDLISWTQDLLLDGDLVLSDVLDDDHSVGLRHWRC
jgi:hypothetical protein